MNLEKNDIGDQRDPHAWEARCCVLVMGILLCAMMTLSSCARTALLRDDDMLPEGSRVEFWVYHDDQGWIESNIHIAWLPRPMSGYETRLWADGVGRRDADMRWTHYRVIAQMPERPRYTYRSRVYGRSNLLERELIIPHRSPRDSNQPSRHATGSDQSRRGGNQEVD